MINNYSMGTYDYQIYLFVNHFVCTHITEQIEEKTKGASVHRVALAKNRQQFGDFASHPPSRATLTTLRSCRCF